ncbi:MAG: NADH-quinone oxidoreductase subunit M, partial [Proteobacteria bacterium]|nr:NADH-quinone oxidoreductase subunit M [Pseudomonadota bacterium]
REFWSRAAPWVFLGLFAGFAVKVPLFPFHTWLPLAHVEAPTAGSVLLAGVLLKVGTYGFLRFNLALLPGATVDFVGIAGPLAVAGILYGALVALAQQDMKKLVAYSSVSHLGFCMLGLFALNPIGLNGALLQMVNHGLSTGALFAIVGMLYARYHTRDIALLGGLTRRMPVMAFFLLLMAFSSIGLPGLNGFVGEVMVLLGMFREHWIYAAFATAGIVLGAWYMLWLVERTFFGPLREPNFDDSQKPVSDVTQRELAALVPIAVLVVWIGIYPQFFLRRMEPSIAPIAAALAKAKASRTESVAARTSVQLRTLPLDGGGLGGGVTAGGCLLTAGGDGGKKASAVPRAGGAAPSQYQAAKRRRRRTGMRRQGGKKLSFHTRNYMKGG